MVIVRASAGAAAAGAAAGGLAAGAAGACVACFESETTVRTTYAPVPIRTATIAAMAHTVPVADEPAPVPASAATPGDAAPAMLLWMAEISPPGAAPPATIIGSADASA